jgi:hypothetical protein
MGIHIREMTTDRKEKENKYKDERNTKTPDAATKPLPSKKKDKRKWCRGKVGIEHELKCVKYDDYKGMKLPSSNNWRLLVCVNCGKELDYYYPITFGSINLHEKVPNWVDC